MCTINFKNCVLGHKNIKNYTSKYLKWKQKWNELKKISKKYIIHKIFYSSNIYICYIKISSWSSKYKCQFKQRHRPKNYQQLKHLFSKYIIINKCIWNQENCFPLMSALCWDQWQNKWLSSLNFSLNQGMENKKFRELRLLPSCSGVKDLSFPVFCPWSLDHLCVNSNSIPDLSRHYQLLRTRKYSVLLTTSKGVNFLLSYFTRHSNKFQQFVLRMCICFLME